MPLISLCVAPTAIYFTVASSTLEPGAVLTTLWHLRTLHSHKHEPERHVCTCRIERLVDTHPVYAPSSYISAPQTHAHSWTGTETTLRPKARTRKGKVAHKALHCSREIRALLAQPRWAWVFLCQVLGRGPGDFLTVTGWGCTTLALTVLTLAMTTKQIAICVYNLYTYMYIYVYMYMCVCIVCTFIYVRESVFIYHWRSCDNTFFKHWMWWCLKRAWSLKGQTCMKPQIRHTLNPNPKAPKPSRAEIDLCLSNQPCGGHRHSTWGPQ